MGDWLLVRSSSALPQLKVVTTAAPQLKIVASVAPQLELVESVRPQLKIIAQTLNDQQPTGRT